MHAFWTNRVALVKKKGIQATECQGFHWERHSLVVHRTQGCTRPRYLLPFRFPTQSSLEKCQRYPDNFNRPFLFATTKTGPPSRTTMGAGASNGAFNARSSSRSAPAPPVLAARLRNGFATASAVEPPPSVCRLVAQGTVVPDAAQALYPLAPCVCGVVVVGLLRHSWEVPRSGFSTQIQSVRVSSAVPLGRD